MKAELMKTDIMKTERKVKMAGHDIWAAVYDTNTKPDLFVPIYDTVQITEA